MSIHSVTYGTALTPSAPAGRFFLPGAAEFANTLNIGQIIEGRVLRGFEGNRYLVVFGKDERVVDSAVPLTAGEIIHGRVVALDDRVELQRVHSRVEQSGETTPTAISESRWDARTSSTDAALVNELMQRYRIELTDADRTALLHAMRAADDSESIALAGAFLSKLGLPQSGALLESLYRAQLPRGVASVLSSAEPSVPEIAVAASENESAAAVSLQELANLLSRIAQAKDSSNGSRAETLNLRTDSNIGSNVPSMQVPLEDSPRRRNSDNDSGQGQDRRWEQSVVERLLNAQTGGVVSHRAGLLPILAGGRLVEISFALFEQRRSASQVAGLQHRQVVFSLQTERMGQVDVTARIAGNHVRVQIATAGDEQSWHAAHYTETLKSDLADRGWAVDEVAYSVRSAAAPDSAVRAVIEHVVSLDSLSRLV